jgi:hypothetical protein
LSFSKDHGRRRVELNPLTVSIFDPVDDDEAQSAVADSRAKPDRISPDVTVTGIPATAVYGLMYGSGVTVPRD